MFTTAVAEHWIKVYTLIETHLHTTLNNRFHTFDITWVVNANVLDMSQISFTHRLVDNKQIRYIKISYSNLTLFLMCLDYILNNLYKLFPCASRKEFHLISTLLDSEQSSVFR